MGKSGKLERAFLQENRKPGKVGWVRLLTERRWRVKATGRMMLIESGEGDLNGAAF
jgi:hypothetical protein